MIGMRVIEAHELATELGRPLLGRPIVGRPHQKAAPRALLGRIGKRHGPEHATVPADQGAAALVRKRLLAVPANGRAHARFERQVSPRHRPTRTIR